MHKRIILTYDKSYDTYTFYSVRKEEPKRTRNQFVIISPESMSLSAYKAAMAGASMNNPDYKGTNGISFEGCRFHTDNLKSNGVKYYNPGEDYD